EPKIKSKTYVPVGARLQDPQMDKPLEGSNGTFHATRDFQWLTQDPPERLYIFSGGGGGDVKSVVLLANMLKMMYENIAQHAEKNGKVFRAPKIVVVDSTIKRSRENPFGGPPILERLGRHDENGNWRSLEKYVSPSGITANHVFRVPKNMYIRYGL